MTEPMTDDLIEQYKKLNQDALKLLAALEATRAQRGVVAGQLLARDGKGKGYDMGDGVEQIVCSTKVGTHYLVARNKWTKRPGVGGAAKPPKAAKPAKGPRVKRAIVNGQIVEVPVGPTRTAATPKPRAKKAVPAPVAVVEPEAVQVAVETTVAPGVPVPVAEAVPQKAAETPPVASPAVAPPAEPEPEIDPLDAALAALDM
jgi:hypothetical protein